ILVRRRIREHYRELTRSNEVTCNHCNLEIIVNVHSLDILHKHLVKAHPDKLTEEEKKNVKIRWVWDYFTLGDSRATCNLCGISLSSRRLSNLIIHLKLTHHNEVTCNHCNLEIIVNVHSLDILHKHLVKAHPDKLTEEEKKNVKVSWVYDYFTVGDSKTTCNICGISFNTRKIFNLSRHLKLTHQIFGPSPDGAINNESNLYNDANWDIRHNLILVRCWIRGHYRELTRSNEVTCNHCNLEIIVNVQYLDILHKHLVEAHPDKLTEEEKKNVKVSWVWDYFTLGDSKTTCNLCGISLNTRRISNLSRHLKLAHHPEYSVYIRYNDRAKCRRESNSSLSLVPYEINVSVPQPYTVEKRVSYSVKVYVNVPVEIPESYQVEKQVPYKVKVGNHVPYKIEVPVSQPFRIEKRIPVEVKVPISQSYTIDPVRIKIPVEKPYLVPVEKPVVVPVKVSDPFRLKVSVDKPHEVHETKPVLVPVKKTFPYVV
ncbi:hypothetical protein ALC56_04833, partial [Trachymyrmex septentrionalis]